MLRRMLVAVDFSVCSRYTARYACDVSRAIGGAVTLLHVLEEHPSRPQDVEVAQIFLRRLSLFARRPPSCLIVPAMNTVNPRGDPGSGDRRDGVAPAILQVADELGLDLILMGLHGQGNTDPSWLGRVVRQVLLHATVPVQVMPCSTTGPIIDRWHAPLADKTALRTRLGAAVQMSGIESESVLFPTMG